MVHFDCGITGVSASSPGVFFEWRKLDVNGQDMQIYFLTSTVYVLNNGTLNGPDRFQRSGDFGLNISNLNFYDGATYKCHLLSPDTSAIANLVVVGEWQRNYLG